MFRTMAAACVAACAMLGAAGSAEAAALIYTGSGTLDAYVGGNSPDDLQTGLAFSFTLTYDLDPAYFYLDLGSGQNGAQGGAAIGRPDLVTGVMTIAGVDYALSGGWSSAALQTTDVAQVSTALTQSLHVTFGAIFADQVLPLDLLQPPPGDLCLVATCYGGGFAIGPYGGQVSNLTSFTVTYDPDGGSGLFPVPEPSTWALMIAGFGGAGAMIRRRRAALA